MAGEYGIAAGINAGLQTINQGMIDRRNMQMQAEQFKMQQQKFGLEMQSAQTREKAAKLQLQQMDLQVKDLQKTLAQKEVFNVFGGYEQTRDASILNSAKSNPMIKQMLENRGTTGFGNISDLSAEKLAELGIDEKVMLDETKRPVVEYRKDGSMRVIDLMQVYAKSGYLPQLGKKKLDEIALKVKENEAKSTEYQAKFDEAKFNDLQTYLTKHPNASYSDWINSSKPKTDNRSSLEKEVEYIKKNFGQAAADTYLKKKTTINESVPAAVKEDKYIMENQKAILEESKASTISEVDYNKLTGDNKLKFDNMVTEETTKMSTSDKDIVDQFNKAANAASKVNVDKLDRSTGIIDAAFNSIADTLGIDRNLIDVGNETQMAVVRNTVVKIISGSQVTGGEWDRMVAELGTNFKADSTARYKFGNALEAMSNQISKRFKDTYPAYYAKTIGPAVRGLNRVINELDGMNGTKPTVPTKGTISKGYEFLGGDPADKNNWRKVQ